MFGGNLCKTIRQRLGTETTWLNLERPSQLSRLHSGNSQVYVTDAVNLIQPFTRWSIILPQTPSTSFNHSCVQHTSCYRQRESRKWHYLHEDWFCCTLRAEYLALLCSQQHMRTLRCLSHPLAARSQSEGCLPTNIHVYIDDCEMWHGVKYCLWCITVLQSYWNCKPTV